MNLARDHNDCPRSDSQLSRYTLSLDRPSWLWHTPTSSALAEYCGVHAVEREGEAPAEPISLADAGSGLILSQKNAPAPEEGARAEWKEWVRKEKDFNCASDAA